MNLRFQSRHSVSMPASGEYGQKPLSVYSRIFVFHSIPQCSNFQNIHHPRKTIIIPTINPRSIPPVQIWLLRLIAYPSSLFQLIGITYIFGFKGIAAKPQQLRCSSVTVSAFYIWTSKANRLLYTGLRHIKGPGPPTTSPKASLAHTSSKSFSLGNYRSGH